MLKDMFVITTYLKTCSIFRPYLKTSVQNALGHVGTMFENTFAQCLKVYKKI